MYVARDKSGQLHLFTIKPDRIYNQINGMFQFPNTWYINLCKGYEMPIDNNLFSNLKWEDEPLEVVLCEIKEFNTNKRAVE